MTIEHSDIGAGEIHEPKGISTAIAGQIYEADGLGSGSWKTLLTSEVVVSALSDFPTPVGDNITLAADTVYIINGDINIGTNRFTMSSNSALRGRGAEYSSITSTTSSNLITATTSFHVDSLKLTASSGAIFSCTGGATESAYIRELTVSSASSLGSFTNWYSFYWDTGAVVSFTSALSFAGTCSIFILELVEFITGYTTAVNLGTATFNTCSIYRCGFGYASATSHITLAASSANINAGKEGRIYQCNFDAGAGVTGFGVGDLRWESRGNLNLRNTTRNAHGYMHTTTVTTIGVGDGDTGNPKLVNGATNWLVDHDDQFTITTGGRFTYNGITTAEFLVTCNISGTTSSGTQTVNHFIAKNGTVITGTKTQREYSSTAIGSPAPAAGIVTLDTGDYVELYLENISGTNNWSSEILNMTIAEVL